MKTLWIIANWKSHKNITQALEWVEEVGLNIPHRPNLKVVVCPTLSCLSEVKKAIEVGNYPLMVGAQNLSQFSEGAYTGEQPAQLLKDLVGLSILGHSERRQNFEETDQIVSQKVERAFEAGIIPLVCVQAADTPVPPNTELIAYEPVFAIGSGTPDTPQDANFVAEKLKQAHGDLPVLYGGSVTPENSDQFLSQPNIEGLLIGGASLEAAEFVKIVQQAGRL